MGGLSRKEQLNLINEIKRLRAGQFTEEEFQNLCHNLNTDDAGRFKTGCLAYQQKLFGTPTSGSEMTFGAFAAMNRTRSEHATGFNHALDSWSPSDWVLAFIGEFGEACNAMKKLNRFRDKVRGNKE